MDNIIEIRHLIYEYVREEGEEPVRAISDVSIDFLRGSFTAIIGQNGSGKSTLAKNLNGIFVPTEGTVTVNGWDTRDEEHIWDVRQAVGMVFQNPDNQLVSSIVEDDVAFGPENLGVPADEIRRRVDQALAAVNMSDCALKAPHQLSGGQKQRIAIAGVIAMDPECIVFDEPTAMLDPQGRRDVMKIIRKLHQRGITVILITHFMEEAAQADRVVIMDQGRIAADGAPREIYGDMEMLRSIRLEPPMAVDLADRLRRGGVDVPGDVIASEDLVEFICQYR